MPHYKIGKSNARYKNGKPAPPFFGPLVLLDYIAPKKAQAFRKIANMPHPQFNQYPAWGTPEYDAEVARRKPIIKAWQQKQLRALAKICKP